MNTTHALSILLLAGALSACTTASTNVNRKNGEDTTYIDPATRKDGAGGVGIESQDIKAMTDAMTRDILITPEIAGRAEAPRVVVDASDFENDSTNRLNKDLITDDLRVQLQRSSKGKIIFLNREKAGMIAKERELKRADGVDAGTLGSSRNTLGADFKMSGKIKSLDVIDTKGLTTRYTQVLFELTDLETGVLVWTNQYEMGKRSKNDEVYR